MTDEGNTSQGKDDVVPKAEYEALNQKFTEVSGQFTEIQKKLGKLDIDTLLNDSKEYKKLKKESIKDPKELEETITKEIETRFSARINELETTNATTSKELKQLRVTNVVEREASEVMLPEGIRLIKPIIDRHCDYEDGQIVVKDDDGKVRYSKKNPKDKMTVREFIDSLAEEFPAIAKATGSGGGRESGQTQSGQSGEMSQEAYLKLTPEERKKLPQKLHQEMAARLFAKPKR